MTENSIAEITVDSCFKIHTTLGPGLLESVYESVLVKNRRQASWTVSEFWGKSYQGWYYTHSQWYAVMTQRIFPKAAKLPAFVFCLSLHLSVLSEQRERA